MFQKHVRLSIVGERVGKPALPPRACSGCASRRAKAQSSARKQAQRRRQEAVLATQGGGRRTAAGQGTGVRRRSPQAYKDDPRNARKRTQESRRRTQSCNFCRICESLAVPCDRTKRLAKKKRRSSSLPLPKRLAYPVKIASEPSIRKPQHGIGRKGWTARRVRWNPSAPRQSGEASTGEAGRQGWTTRLDAKATRKEGFASRFFSNENRPQNGR